MQQLIPVDSRDDIPEQYLDTPIGNLLEYHNLDKTHSDYAKAELLVGMCMDNRKSLDVPDNFAFIIRAGGANLRYSEFKVSFAIGYGGVQHIALIGHNHCGMVNLMSKKEQFVQGLMDKGGWSEQQAEEHFLHYSPMFEIGNEVDFVLSEVKRLRNRHPKITVVPMLYKVEDNRLYVIEE